MNRLSDYDTDFQSPIPPAEVNRGDVVYLVKHEAISGQEFFCRALVSSPKQTSTVGLIHEQIDSLRATTTLIVANLSSVDGRTYQQRTREVKPEQYPPDGYSYEGDYYLLYPCVENQAEINWSFTLDEPPLIPNE